MKILTKISSLILAMFCFAGSVCASAAEIKTTTQEIENYINALGELQGEKS